MPQTELSSVIAQFSKQLPNDTLEHIIRLLEIGKLTQETTIRGWSNLIQPYSVPVFMLHKLTSIWNENEEYSPVAMALAFRSSLEVRNYHEDNQPQVDLVWSGPYPASPGLLRPTLQVFQSMIENSNRSIFMTGYSLSDSSDGLKLIIHKLALAKNRGVEIKIALHEDGNNEHVLLTLWPKDIPYPTLLHWRGIPGDSMAKLHAKILLVDNNDLLVTSANLSYHGLDANIEVGIRLGGNKVYEISRQFSALERDGILHVKQVPKSILGSE